MLTSGLHRHTPTQRFTQTHTYTHTMYTRVTVHWVTKEFMPEVVLPSEVNSGPQSFQLTFGLVFIIYYFIPQAGGAQARL